MTQQEVQTTNRQASLTLNWDQPALKLLSFDEVHETAQKLEDLRIEPDKVKAKGRGLDPDYAEDVGYDVLDLRSLRFNSIGSVFVPGFGALKMTLHSMRQLGAEIGVNWTKHYGHMPAADIQRDVRSHLKYRPTPCIKRVIARKHGAFTSSPVGDIATEGILRGFVSPTYTEIKDVRLFERIREVAGPGELEEQAVAISAFKDNGSHFMLVNREPVDLLTAQPKGGSITSKPADGAYFGIRIRNSEVGAYALTGDPYFVRYACVNGVIVGIKEDRLLYRQHRGVNDKELNKLIENMYKELPERHKKIVSDNQKMHRIRFKSEKEAREEIISFMSTESRSLKQAALKAFDKEPICTAYGVMQAIARVAMAARGSMDRQYEIEALAGKYIQRVL